MNLKQTFAIASAVALISSSTAAYAKTMEFTMGSTSLYISENGISQVEIETAPYTENDRTMVPVRIIGENFGAVVSWDEQTSGVTIEDGTNRIELTIGSNEAVVNGNVVPLDAPAKEIGGRTMVPLRFISENLGKNVSYIEATEQVLISDETPILTVNENTYTIDDYRALIGITEGASRDDLVYLAGQATSVFTELGAVASAADRAGFLISGQELAYVKDNLIPYSDEIYKISLMAPLARNQTETLKAQAYLTITSNLNIENADIASSYNTDYIKANHILILTQDRNTMEPYSAEKKAEAAKLAESILQRLKKGEDFDKLCDEYTEDPGHITQPDGYIFTKGEMVKEFEDAAYGLKDGEISDIVETSYGYHIIKRLPLPELDAETEEYIQSSLLNAEFNRLYSECMDTADIQPHMSPDEIADLLG